MNLNLKNFAVPFLFIFLIFTLNSQESLKSIEEDYYDFLSLTGVVKRPTLGYRSLSDNVWTFNEIESFEKNEEVTFTKVRTSGEQSPTHIWKNNNLGTTYTLWQPASPIDNWFTRGIKQNFTVRIYGPEWFNSYNTATPYGQNDGGLWQGRGYNTALTAGLRLEGYGFELTFKPQVSWSQNKEFDYLPGVYGDNHSYFYYRNIDLVQGYGDSSFWNFDWGDSEIRWTWHTLTFGFGTQSTWLGPAWLNPMLGSNNASSYPKFDIGLRKTSIYIPFTNIYIGDLEFRIWTGLLSESDYFDSISSNNSRMLNALSAGYHPSFIPGFTFGINRIFITNWATHNIKYLLRLFSLGSSNTNGSQTGNGEDEDQKASIFVDWKFTKIGFEFYGELGIDDFAAHPMENPFHTAIYTIGIKQAIPISLNKFFPKIPDLNSEIIFEWNNFEMSQDFQMQWRYMGYYAHERICQGYTQNGQIIGAGTGYFGNSQFLGYKIIFNKGYIMPYFHRHSPDNNYIYNKTVGNADTYGSETYEKYYSCFKTYREFGTELSFFINPDFNIISNFSVTYIAKANYTKNSMNFFNFRGYLNLKYNF